MPRTTPPLEQTVAQLRAAQATVTRLTTALLEDAPWALAALRPCAFTYRHRRHTVLRAWPLPSPRSRSTTLTLALYLGKREVALDQTLDTLAVLLEARSPAGQRTLADWSAEIAARVAAAATAAHAALAAADPAATAPLDARVAAHALAGCCRPQGPRALQVGTALVCLLRRLPPTPVRRTYIVTAPVRCVLTRGPDLYAHTPHPVHRLEATFPDTPTLTSITDLARYTLPHGWATVHPAPRWDHLLALWYALEEAEEERHGR